MKILRFFACVLALIAEVLCVGWAFGAIYFDFPIANAPAAILFVLFLTAIVVFVRGLLPKLAGVFGAFAIILLWWLTLKPSNDCAWQPDVAQTAWAEINGDEVTVHNVRNCDYRTETDFTPHWETRTVRLSQITGMDVAINYWGSPWIAHPIVSFQFADALPLCFSIETRKTIGQQYSTLEGFYRQYTLIYVVADERDCIRLRTNYRREDVYLYHTLASPAQARERFREYIKTLNALREKPRWYNAVTSNCTTSIRTQRAVKLRAPWDWRILLNGKADEMLYQDHAIATGGLSFTELKQRSLIDERARAADRDPDFSRVIREGLPKAD
ncbi:MAG TPA: DUF4105 domain-containing protein [Candidatus Udaeobacter sp.]|nr:DUF4105 domain-containing protein [Candidatus Udaeobacter sp.]